MREILRLVIREFKKALHDPRRFAFLLGPPIVYLCLFSMLYVPNIVKNIPTVICDEENSHFSRTLVRDFESTDTFDVTQYVNTEEDVRDRLQHKDAYVAIVIPRDFSKDIKTGTSSNVMLMINGSNIMLTSSASSAATNVLADFNNRVAAKSIALTTGAREDTLARRIAPVDVRLRVLYNSTQGYLFFFVLGLVMAAYQQGIFFATGTSITSEFEKPELHDHTLKLLLAKGIYYWTLAMISYVIVAGLIQWISEIPLKAPLYELLFLAGSFLFAAISFCMFFASFFPKEMEFMRGIAMYPVPAFILSGYTWPHASMNELLQFISNFIPLSWFANPVRELFLSGTSPHLMDSVEALMLLGFGYFILAIPVFKHMSEKMAARQ